MREVSERALEKSFVDWCSEQDIEALKGPVGLSKGFPDRFAMLNNGGGTVYVEFKGSSYYDLTQMQCWWREYLLKSSPNRYFVVRNHEDLAHLKCVCLALMQVGPHLADYERDLMSVFVETPLETPHNDEVDP